MDYDRNGETARSGKIEPGLLNELNNLDFYSAKWPKSLCREWLDDKFIPLIDNYSLPVENLLRTVSEHIAMQVTQSLNSKESSKILVTGGGAHNKFLLERIKALGHHDWIIPRADWIDFKEALVFAFLGVLRWREDM